MIKLCYKKHIEHKEGSACFTKTMKNMSFSHFSGFSLLVYNLVKATFYNHLTDKVWYNHTIIMLIKMMNGTIQYEKLLY